MSKTLAPSVTTRDPKGLKFVSVVEDAYNKTLLSEEEAQRVNEASGLAELVGKFIAEKRKSNQFGDEEVGSTYTYPTEYTGPEPIGEQIGVIAEIFGLDPGHALEFAKNLPELPEGAEGWFAIPSVDALAAKHFPEVTDPAEKYCRAVQLVHQKIAASRRFYNYREGQITPAQLRAHARTAHALESLAEVQKGDILIVAAQLGMRHRGRSVRRARAVFAGNEFGLGSLAGGSIVLTHPERLVRLKQLHMDCSGDEFSPAAAGQFEDTPYFGFRDDEVQFDTGWVGGAYEHYGSASGFLPQ